jgi:hypothetical protein
MTCRQRVVRLRGRSQLSEKEIADRHLGDFKAEESRGLALLNRIYPKTAMTRHSMSALAVILSNVFDIPLERDSSRRKDLLIKWFDDHYDKLEPNMHHITLLE